MSHRWLYLDAALALVGCDRQELAKACHDGDVIWRARDESGALLEPSYHWTGEIDWSARPPRFKVEEPQLWIISGPELQGSGEVVQWGVAEVERGSLLTHFVEPEPLAVRLVEPVSVVLRRAAGAMARTVGRKPKGHTQAHEIVDEFVRMADRGEVSYAHGGLAAAAKQLAKKFPNYTPKHIADLIRSHHQDRKTGKR